MAVLLWCLCVLVAARGGVRAVPRDIFVLAGQSNMAGRGGVFGGKWDGDVPPECRPSPWVLRFSAQLKWEEACEPLHADIDVTKTCGVGPGMAFANELVKTHGPGFVGLVPCAVGATKISQWSRGSRLYNQLVQRAALAMGEDGGTIRALLWYQGESDTVTKIDAESYKDKMERFIINLRSDLNLPSLLVIQVALASGEGKFIEKVRRAQMGITLPNVKCVDAKGLRLKPDQLHLTTMSQVHLGIRLARAYLASSTHHYQFNCNINHTQFIAI